MVSCLAGVLDRGGGILRGRLVAYAAVSEAMAMKSLLLLLSLMLAGVLDITGVGPEDAVREIERHGFGISKPMPVVRVFAAQRGGAERDIDDDDVRAIVPALNKLDQLGAIDLRNTGVGDDCIRSLIGVPRLEWVSLVDTGVSEKAMEGLKALPKLATIYLREGQLSEAELQRLKESMPGVTVKLLAKKRPATATSRSTTRGG
jgi:hypothetical protein